MNVREKIISLTDAINEHFDTDFDNLTDAIQYALDNGGGEIVKRLYANYMGFVTPNDGAYSDWVYNNMYAIGDDIYFSYMCPQTHWNPSGVQRSRMTKYNVKSRTYEYWERTCDGETFSASATIYDPTDGCFYSFDKNYRYKSTDKGRTWTKEAHGGALYANTRQSLHYLTRLSNGRLIVAPDNTNMKEFAISDDKGLTWRKSNPFSAYGLNHTLTHCRFFEVETGVIVGYYFTPFYNDFSSSATRNKSFRWVTVSNDNGDTWSEPVHCQGELEDASVSYMTGAFAYYNDEYHYFTAERLPDTNNLARIGRIRWFTGTKEQVLNGTMQYKDTIANIDVLSAGSNNAWNSASISDSGNIGCCVASDGVYVIYGSVMDELSVGSTFSISNQGLKMLRVGNPKVKNVVDSYFDENHVSRLDSMYEEKTTNHSYYYYMTGENNFGFDFVGADGKSKLPKKSKFMAEVGDSNFEVNVIYNATNLTNPTNENLSSGYSTYMPIGFQKADGSLHAFVKNATQIMCLDLEESNQSMGCCAGFKGNGYITLKRTNGDLEIMVNGLSIKNPIYEQKFAKNYCVLNDVKKDSIVWNFDPDSNDGEWVEWLESLTAWVLNNQIRGFKMITIDIDGYVRPEEPEEPEEPPIQATYPTDGLIAYYDVGNELNWNDGECVAENGATFETLGYIRSHDHLAFANVTNKKNPTIFENNTCNGCLVVKNPNLSQHECYTIACVSKNNNTVELLGDAGGGIGTNALNWYDDSSQIKTTQMWTGVYTDDGLIKKYLGTKLCTGGSSTNLKEQTLTGNKYNAFAFGQGSSGRVGDCFIYGKELSEEEIAQLYEYIQTRHTIGS